MREMKVRLTVDDSLGITDAASGFQWKVTELYPREGATVNLEVWRNCRSICSRQRCSGFGFDQNSDCISVRPHQPRNYAECRGQYIKFCCGVDQHKRTSWPGGDCCGQLWRPCFVACECEWH